MGTNFDVLNDDKPKDFVTRIMIVHVNGICDSFLNIFLVQEQGLQAKV